MGKRRNPITRERARTTMLISTARLTNRQCCVWLHIADGMGHADILDELFEDFMKAQKRITFPTVEIPEITCIRSEREYCIVPEDAIIVDGELPRDVSMLKPPACVDNAESHVWHFAGGIWLVDSETCFCEYDADKREGGMIIFFDGKNILKLLEKYPQLKQNIKFAKHDQYNWLVDNW